MRQSIAEEKLTTAVELDSEVVAFRRQFEDGSTLDQIIREGAQRMLHVAINAEVDSFVDRER